MSRQFASMTVATNAVVLVPGFSMPSTAHAGPRTTMIDRAEVTWRVSLSGKRRAGTEGTRNVF